MHYEIKNNKHFIHYCLFHYINCLNFINLIVFSFDLKFGMFLLCLLRFFCPLLPILKYDIHLRLKVIYYRKDTYLLFMLFFITCITGEKLHE